MVSYQGSKKPAGVHRWQKEKHLPSLQSPRLEPQLSHLWIGHVTPNRHSHVQ